MRDTNQGMYRGGGEGKTLVTAAWHGLSRRSPRVKSYDLSWKMESGD